MGIASLNSQPSALICSAIASLRIAHEDTSAARPGSAWCEIQAAQRALEAAAAELHAQLMPPMTPELPEPLVTSLTPASETPAEQAA